MPNCVFCRIVSKELPASLIYEDEQVMCFMDIHPVDTGACMVIPKQHIDHFTDLPDLLASHIVLTAQKVGRNILRELHAQRVGYVVHGYGVPHAHFNIVPLNRADDIVSAKAARIVDGQIVFDDSFLPTVDHTELDKVAALLKL